MEKMAEHQKFHLTKHFCNNFKIPLRFLHQAENEIHGGVKTTLESHPVERLTKAPIRNLSAVAGNGLKLTYPKKYTFGMISKSSITITLEWRRRR